MAKVNNLLNRSTFWVYYGQLNNDKTAGLTKNFISNDGLIPARGSEIISSGDITKRDALPVGSGDKWALGNVIGYVNKNTKVNVLDVREIEDQNIWVKVQL